MVATNCVDAFWSWYYGFCETFSSEDGESYPGWWFIHIQHSLLVFIIKSIHGNKAGVYDRVS